MNLDVLILSNDMVQFSEASENVKEFFGVAPRVLNGAESIAKGYNQLARQSKADVLCFMHQDARIGFPASVLFEYFKGLENPGVLGFCGSGMQVPGRQWWECAPTYGSLTQGYGTQAGILKFNPTQFSINGEYDYQPVQTMDGYCLFMSRKSFEGIGGFDEEYDGWHGYDIDICTKFLNAGFQNYVINQPSQHFSWGSSGPSLTIALNRFFTKWSKFYNGQAS